jgi:hypothetical protein
VVDEKMRGSTEKWEVLPRSGVPLRFFCSNPECILHTQVKEIEDFVVVSEEPYTWKVGHKTLKRKCGFRPTVVCDICEWEAKAALAQERGEPVPEFDPQGGWWYTNPEPEYKPAQEYGEYSSEAHWENEGGRVVDKPEISPAQKQQKEFDFGPDYDSYMDQMMKNRWAEYEFPF